MENKSRMHKQGIRSKYLGYRDALGAEVRLQKSMQIWENIKKQPEFQEAENVLVYMDYRSEVMTTGLVEEMFLSEAPKRVFAPVVEGMTISFYEIRSLSDLHAGYQDIREPQEDKEKLFTEEIAGQKTLVLVPGSVFDRSGNRMGYGKGFYDRFLKAFPSVKSAGLAFDVQIAPVTIPCEEQDRRVDMVITESEVIRNI